MYLCVCGLDHVLVCVGSRSCTCVYGVSIMYLCVWGLDHVPVRTGSRSCTCVYGVSIMYLCVCGLHCAFFYYFHIWFWNCSDIVIFFVFKSLIGIIQYKRLNKLQNVAVIYINIKIHIDLYHIFFYQYSLFRGWSYIGTRNRAVCTTIFQLFHGGKFVFEVLWSRIVTGWFIYL